MRTSALFILSGLTLILHATPVTLHADASEPPSHIEESPHNAPSQAEAKKEKPPAAPFVPFTGKITKNKVRMRQQASLDSPILKEMNQGDLVIVAGETEDFYAVHPPTDTKAYIFRTFVLDNIVEGSRVNIRLEPDTESPIVTQLSAGVHVEGTISPLNSKWLEITMPESARFFVAKDYIENIGDRNLMATLEKRQSEANRLLNSTYIISQTELQKPFSEIQLDGAYESLNKLINQYQDFPEQTKKARELLTVVQDNYLKKKVAYLESRAQAVNQDLNSKNSQMNDQVQMQQARLTQLEEQLERERNARANRAASVSQSIPEKTQDAYGFLVNNKMSGWAPREQEIYQSWALQNNDASEDEFYLEQADQAVAITGIIEPYTRAISNKPGDYILINRASHLPIAYLYSTQIDLQHYVGHEVTLRAAPRSNNNFAFPAYFILSAE